MTDYHWCQSALNSAGALQGGGGEFQGIFTPFYTINFRGGCKSGGARATVASASLAPLWIWDPKSADTDILPIRIFLISAN